MPIINSVESLSICYCLQIKYSLIINVSFKRQHKGDISDVCLLAKDLRISCHQAMCEFNLLLRIFFWILTPFLLYSFPLSPPIFIHIFLSHPFHLSSSSAFPSFHLHGQSLHKCHLPFDD